MAILTPTAAQGTVDPAVPAFPEVIDFVNPANPEAFFSFAFLIAGGSGNNELEVFLCRELELSVFDTSIVDDGGPLNFDNVEAPGGDVYAVDFSDGGWFTLQAGFVT